MAVQLSPADIVVVLISLVVVMLVGMQNLLKKWLCRKKEENTAESFFLSGDSESYWN